MLGPIHMGRSDQTLNGWRPSFILTTRGGRVPRLPSWGLVNVRARLWTNPSQARVQIPLFVSFVGYSEVCMKSQTHPEELRCAVSVVYTSRSLVD